ncbi:MAG: carboxylesterase family protein, partial [Suipraeoptans sp.]
ELVSRGLASMGLCDRGALMTDRFYGALRARNHPNSKTYSYLFSHITPSRPEEKGTPRDQEKLLAWHSSELWYTFASLRENVPPARPWTEVDFRLADQMSSYWANFIKNGNPNGDELPFWPASDENYGWMDLSDVPTGHEGIEMGIEEMIYHFTINKPVNSRY